MYFLYLTTNENRNEPKFLSDKNYVHLKASQDGNHTLIASEVELIDSSLTSYRLDEAKTLLAAWDGLDKKTDPDGVSSPVNLDLFIEEDELAKTARIESYKQRCERVGSFEKDEQRVELVEWAVNTMSKPEWQLYFDQMEKNIMIAKEKEAALKPDPVKPDEVTPVEAIPVEGELKLG